MKVRSKVKNILNKNISLYKSRYIHCILYLVHGVRGSNIENFLATFSHTIETLWSCGSCLGPININSKSRRLVCASGKFCQILCKSQIATDFFLPELENQGLLSCKPSFSIMAFEVLPFHSRRRLHGRPFSMFAILPEYV